MVAVGGIGLPVQNFVYGRTVIITHWRRAASSRVRTGGCTVHLAPAGDTGHVFMDSRRLPRASTGCSCGTPGIVRLRRDLAPAESALVGKVLDSPRVDCSSGERLVPRWATLARSPA